MATWLDEPEAAALYARAADNDRSAAAEIRRAIRLSLQNDEREPVQAPAVTNPAEVTGEHERE